MAIDWLQAGAGVGAVVAFLLFPIHVARAQIPANSCGNAPYVAVPGDYAGSTVGATADSTATCGTTGGSPDVWLRFVAAQTAAVAADTCTGTNFDSVLSVRAGCSGPELACNDDFCGITSRLLFAVTAGSTYWVRVSGFSGEIGPFILSLAYTDPPPAPTPGPDVSIGELNSIQRWGRVGDVSAYSIGATACNLGDADVQWAPPMNQHPVVVQSMYRLRAGRFEQIGQSWGRHVTGAVNNGFCGSCNGHVGSVLGVGCSDAYGSGLNGEQAALGPRSDVHPTTGAHIEPVAPPGVASVIDRRLQVGVAEVDPELNIGAAYFAEALCITADDAAARNALNNASFRRISIIGVESDPTFAGATDRGRPAICAWKDLDPAVMQVNADYQDSGLPARFIVAARATDLGDGTWNYEYAVYNLNSDRAAGRFAVPLPTAALVKNVEFRDVPYHSGDGLDGKTFDGTDWTFAPARGEIGWATQPFHESPNANALRWGTLYNFRFDTNVAPISGRASIGLFKPGGVGEPDTVFAAGIPVPSCAADWNRSGFVNSQDFFDFVTDLFNLTADFNADGYVNSQDFFDFIAAFFEGC